MADNIDDEAGPGPGRSTVPSWAIALILALMVAAAGSVMWTLARLLQEAATSTSALAADSVRTAARDSTPVQSTRDTTTGTAPTQLDTNRVVPGVRRDTAGTASTLSDSTARSSARDPDTTLFLIVVLAGALGGLLHGVRSFVWYVGNRELVWSWIPMYLTLPVVGSLLAGVIYLVVRAGFVGFSSGSPPSPYGFAAASALIGMFNQAAILKLKDVAETLFKKPPEGADARPQNSGKNAIEAAGAGAVDSTEGDAPVPVIVSAKVQQAGGTNSLIVDGTGFRKTSQLFVDQVKLEITTSTPKQLTATLPATVVAAKNRKVTVVTPPPGGGSSTTVALPD